MAEPVRIEPDLQFIKELQEVGGESLKKCYQCATCSVACPIAPAGNPYPRKEMIWAQWGLKDKLESDIDIWLCHNCGTCSDLCPRGAKPGDLLSALRNMVYRKLTGPAILGKWMSSIKGLPFLFAIPAIIFGVIWVIMAGKRGTAFPLNGDGLIEYGVLFPGDYTIDPIFLLTTILVVLTFVAGVRKLLRSFSADGSVMVLGKKKSALGALISAVAEIVTHSKFETCGTEKAPRKIGHLALFYGFVCLAIVTGVVAVGHWGGHWLGHQLAGHEEPAGFAKFLIAFGDWTHTPIFLMHPIKLLANLGAVLLLVGLTLLTIRRAGQEDKITSSSYHDWYLLGVIWAVALTGIGSELMRLAQFKYIAYPVYYLHLVFVFMLIAYLPWSKLGHLVYRLAAVTYAKYRGRKQL